MAAPTQRIGRAGFLRRGGTLLVAASGVGAFAPAAFADAQPAGDLAYLRLLIAGELLAVDFLSQAFEHGHLRRPASALAREIRSNDHAHYELLAALMVAAGQTPATAADIDFSYPATTFRSQRLVVEFGLKLKRVLVGAYIDALEQVQTPGYRATLAQILANEAQHHAALAALVADRLIEKPLPSPVSMDAVSNFLGRFES